MARTVESRRYALEQLQFFSSEKIIFLFDLFRRLAPFCCSAQLADLTCLKPPASSVPGVATPRASVSPTTFRARETCCWSGSYSILNCRNVNVLPKKLTVRDCDDSVHKVTTLLSSYAPCNRLTLCMLSSLPRRPTVKKVVTVHQDVGLQDVMEEMARRSRRLGRNAPASMTWA